MKPRKKIDIFKNVYLCLALIRVILVLVPQIGYIHPDEYFQSVEVLTGKFLDVECSLPWEFKTTFPIRSMALPYFTIGITIKFLKDINNIIREYLPNINFITPYSLLIAPRVLMCFFSFVVDFALYKICVNNNEKYKSRLVILASSYVMIVYGTRTFSNTLELVLFAILLYFVSESLTFSNILTRKREYINFRYEKSKSTVERAKFHKLRLIIVSDSYRHCLHISTVTVIGFFNRPTFLAFAIIPIFFWLYRGIGTKSVTALQFHLRMLVILICAIPTLVLIILIDSFYYGFITWGEVGMLDVSINNFVFTPLNFLKYNLNTDNLAVHGLHPKFLHILVNVPLLFNVMGLLALYSILKQLYWCVLRKINFLPSVRSIKCLMTLSFLTPLVLLSIFPHQEPRFLIPIVLPLVYLHGMAVLPEPEDSLMEAQKVQITTTKIQKHSYSFLKLWLFLNMFLTIFYGFLHQGGVFQATSYLAKELNETPLSTQFHIVTSHIYSLPESFLMQKPSNKLYSKGKFHYKVNRRVHLYEEGSKDVRDIVKELKIIASNENMKKNKVYLLISSSLEDDLYYHSAQQNLNFEIKMLFFPHLSVEAFPDLSKYCLDIMKMFYASNCNNVTVDQYFKYIMGMFKLNLYKIHVN